MLGGVVWGKAEGGTGEPWGEERSVVSQRPAGLGFVCRVEKVQELGRDGLGEPVLLSCLAMSGSFPVTLSLLFL